MHGSSYEFLRTYHPRTRVHEGNKKGRGVDAPA
jgi:hypothetical protein